MNWTLQKLGEPANTLAELGITSPLLCPAEQAADTFTFTIPEVEINKSLPLKHNDTAIIRRAPRPAMATRSAFARSKSA